MGKLIGQIMFYITCIVICIAGGICGFKVFQNMNSRSHNIGKAEYVDIYADFNVFDFEVPEPTFYNDNKTRKLTYDVLKAFEFDGTENKFNLLINNEPCNYTISSYGILNGEFIKTFYNLYNEKMATLTFNITFEFYDDYTEFYITLDCSDEDYSLVLKYLKKNGLKVRLIKEQYNTSQEDTIDNKVWVKFVNSDNELIDMRNITKGSSINDFEYSSPTGYDVVYKINNNVIALDSYNFNNNTIVTIELVKQKFNVTFKTDKGLVLSSNTYEYGTTLTEPNINIIGYNFTLQEELIPVMENKTYTYVGTLKEGYLAYDNIVLTNDNNTAVLSGVDSNFNFYAYGRFNSAEGGVNMPVNFSGNIQIPYVPTPALVTLTYENDIITLNTSLYGSLNLMYISENLHRTVSYYSKDNVLLQSYSYLSTEEKPTYIAPVLEDYEFVEWQVKEQTDNNVSYIAVYKKIDIDYKITYKVYGKGYHTKIIDAGIIVYEQDTTNNWCTFIYTDKVENPNYNPITSPNQYFYTNNLKNVCKYKTPIGNQVVTGTYYVMSKSNTAMQGFPSNAEFNTIILAGSTFKGFSITQDKSGLINQSTWYPTADTTLYLIYE